MTPLIGWLCCPQPGPHLSYILGHVLPGSLSQTDVKGMGLASQHSLAEAGQPAPQVLSQEGFLLAQTDQCFLLVTPLSRLRFPLGQMGHEFQF
jgi:hypothetical protein